MATVEERSEQIEQLYKRFSKAFHELCDSYGLRGAVASEIQKQFREGAREMFADSALEFLRRHVGTDVEIAEALGIDRSSLSKYRKRRRIPLDLLMDIVFADFPCSQKETKDAGLMKAASWVRRYVFKDAACRSEISIEEYLEVLQLHKRNGWLESLIAVIGILERWT